MTVVNAQITDAVAPSSASESSPKTFVEALEAALARAAADAVAAQQQFYVLAQAATTQGVAAMLSIDTAATAEQVKSRTEEAAASVRSAPAEEDEAVAAGPAQEVIRGSAIAREMNALGEAFCRNLMRVVQIAATSACLTAMIAEPDEERRYRQVLEAIKSLV